MLDLKPLNLDDSCTSSRPTLKPLDGREVAPAVIMNGSTVLVAHLNRRIMSELIKTPEGNLRVDSANEIVDRSVAEQIEWQDNR